MRRHRGPRIGHQRRPVTVGSGVDVRRERTHKWPVPLRRCGTRLIALGFYEASATRIIAVDATVKVFIGRWLVSRRSVDGPSRRQGVRRHGASPRRHVATDPRRRQRPRPARPWPQLTMARSSRAARLPVSASDAPSTFERSEAACIPPARGLCLLWRGQGINPNRDQTARWLFCRAGSIRKASPQTPRWGLSRISGIVHRG